MKKTLKVNAKLVPFLTKPQPIKVAIGGRNSGKSLGVGDLLAFKMEAEAADVYCLREFQDSITDSVHRVFKGSINERLKLDGWTILESRVIAPNGAITTYKGANRNPDAMQSAQGYRYSWFEEAHRASQASLDKLLPTIIRNPGAQCWFTANPQSQADPFSQRLIVPFIDDILRDGYYEDDLHYIVMINWRDNPWYDDAAEQLRQWDLNNLPRAKYDWIWEGAFLDEVDGSIIKPEWFDAAIDAHKVDKLKKALAPRGLIVAAHDPSGGGADSKGYCLRHGSIVKKVSEMKTGEVDEGFDWAINNAIDDNADWFVWDSDGMGAGAKRQVDAALNGKHIKYHMFRGSLSGSGQDNAKLIYQPGSGDEHTKPKTYAETFKNNRAQFYLSLADRFYNTYRAVERGEYIDPDDMISLDSEGIENMPGLRSELCRVPLKRNNNGLRQIMSKEDMAKEGISSPNMGDSIMMSLYSPKTETFMAPINYPEMSIV